MLLEIMMNSCNVYARHSAECFGTAETSGTKTGTFWGHSGTFHVALPPKINQFDTFFKSFFHRNIPNNFPIAAGIYQMNSTKSPIKGIIRIRSIFRNYHWLIC